METGLGLEGKNKKQLLKIQLLLKLNEAVRTFLRKNGYAKLFVNRSAQVSYKEHWIKRLLDVLVKTMKVCNNLKADMLHTHTQINKQICVCVIYLCIYTVLLLKC